MTDSKTDIKEGQIESEELENFWKDHVETWSKSNISQAEYCRRNGLREKRLTYWKRKFDKDTNAVSFIPVKVTLPFLAKTLVLSIGSRYRIEVNGDFDSAILSKLVRTLEELQ